MKICTKTTILRNFTLLFMLVSFSPCVYALNQNSFLKNDTSVISFSHIVLDDEVDRISTSSDFFDVKNSSTEVTYSIKEKVRRGIVQTIDASKNNIFVIKIGNTQLHVETTATTTLYFGDGEKTNIHSIDYGTKIYIFGHIKSDNSSILASKIVIANESKLRRR